MRKRLAIPCAMIMLFYLQHLLHLQTLVHFELSSLDITKPQAVETLSTRLKANANGDTAWVFEVRSNHGEMDDVDKLRFQRPN